METFLKFEGENELAFYKRFSEADACYSYLAYHKWKDGFVCPSCGCTEEYACKEEHHKRCKQCLHLESPTANTLFHKLKFGISKAFFAVFKLTATSKGISSEQLAKSIGVNRKTALAFSHKVRLAMQSSENYPLKGQVEVDEAFIGEEESGENRGRGAEKKAQIVVAIEKSGNYGLKRMYARKIENASADELKTIFEKHIDAKAKVLTDKWKGYSPLANLYNIEQEKSQPDKNFQVMHRGIQQLKSWLRGIHHAVDSAYLQAYLNEFCYRSNRSIHKNTIFDNLIQRMINTPKCQINQIKFAYCK